MRLGLYRRVGGLQSDAESEAMAAELVDRFGPLPRRGRQPAAGRRAQAHVPRSRRREARGLPERHGLQFRGNSFRNPAGLIAWLSRRKDAIRLRPDHKLAVVQDMGVAERMRIGRDVLLGNLNRLANEGAKAA